MALLLTCWNVDLNSLPNLHLAYARASTALARRWYDGSCTMAGRTCSLHVEAALNNVGPRADTTAGRACRSRRSRLEP